MANKNRFQLGIWFQNQQIKKLGERLRRSKHPEERLVLKGDIKIAKVKRNTLYKTLVLYLRTGKRI